MSPDFSISDWDAGVKTNTATDRENYLRLVGEIGLAPLLADRIAGGSRLSGWIEDTDVGGGVGTLTDKAGSPDHIEVIQTINRYSHVQRADALAANMEVIARMRAEDTNAGSTWAPSITLYWDIDNWCRASIEHSVSIKKFMYMANVASDNAWGRVGTTVAGTWYYLRVKIDASNYIIDYSADGIAWTNMVTVARPIEYSGAPVLVIIGKGYSDTPTYTNPDFDNSLATAGTGTSKMTDMTVFPYNLIGDVESAVEPMPASKKMGISTIFHSGLTAARYIDKIEWHIGGVVKATYDTNIIAGASTSIAEYDLTSGSFENVVGDFTVKTHFRGELDGTPTMEKVEGDFIPVECYLYTALQTGLPENVILEAGYLTTSPYSCVHSSHGVAETDPDICAVGHVKTDVEMSN